jgi:hypothetical protein
MFATGFIIGSIAGTVMCLVTAVLHGFADGIALGRGGETPVRPTLVPLQVTPVSRSSLN